MAIKLRIEDDSFNGGASKCHIIHSFITRNMLFVCNVVALLLLPLSHDVQNKNFVECIFETKKKEVEQNGMDCSDCRWKLLFSS